jgi:RNA polymerase sigma-70 factor, ECF subfamily
MMTRSDEETQSGRPPVVKEKSGNKAKLFLCSSRQDPDYTLVVRVQSGDLRAFEELVARHSQRVYRRLLAIVANREEARDALQDTFLKAFMHINGFQHRSKFSTWLMTIASNTAVQRLRDCRPVESIDSEVADRAEPNFPSWQPRSADDPEQGYSASERCELVRSGVMKLPVKYREVLVLRDLEELPTGKTAAILGVEVATAKSRLFRARAMLRALLSQHFAPAGISLAS